MSGKAENAPFTVTMEQYFLTSWKRALLTWYTRSKSHLFFSWELWSDARETRYTLSTLRRNATRRWILAFCRMLFYSNQTFFPSLFWQFLQNALILRASDPSRCSRGSLWSGPYLSTITSEGIHPGCWARGSLFIQEHQLAQPWSFSSAAILAVFWRREREIPRQKIFWTRTGAKRTALLFSVHLNTDSRGSQTQAKTLRSLSQHSSAPQSQS